MFAEYITPEKLNQLNSGTLMETIGIEFTEVGEDYLEARMPVDERTFQPMKLLHGGASMALAETVGSCASACLVDLNEYAVVGSEISGSHIKSARSGYVKGRAYLLHRGKSSHIWEIKITDDSGALLNVSRVTNRILKINKKIMTDSFREAISYCIEHSLSFVAYRLPGESDTCLLVDKGLPERLNDITEANGKHGFIFAPFHQKDGKSIRFFKEDLLFIKYS